MVARLAVAQPAAVTEADYVIRDFRFTSGEVLPELRLHYRTVGTPQRDASGRVRNAVIVMHGTGGTGAQFVGPGFAGELFGPGQPLDAAKYFIVMPDAIGHGKSSKPSDGLRAKFPRYGYQDMVRAQYLLMTEGLGASRLRLVMGTSMGGMHTWVWGETYPDAMDALMPLASLPDQISGAQSGLAPRGDRCHPHAIRSWQDGNYTTQPRGLRTVAQMLWLAGSNPVIRQKQAPTLADADRVLDEYVDAYVKTGDANDILYAIEASRDYDPKPGLEKIVAPLVAINSADDIINPPELGVLEREIARVKQRQGDRAAAQRQDGRPRHAHGGGGVEGAPGGAAEGDGEVGCRVRGCVAVDLQVDGHRTASGPHVGRHRRRRS